MSNNEQPVLGDAPPKDNVLLSNRLYDRLKFIAQVLLPGLGTLYFTLSGIWGEGVFANPDQVSGTVLAVDTFLGLFLVATKIQYKNSDARFDGAIVVKSVEATDEEEGYSTLNVRMDPDAVANKGEVTLKVKDVVEH